MLLSRDYVTYMAQEVAKRLVALQMIETSTPEALAHSIRAAMAEELSVEDRVNEETRQILADHSEEMRRTGVSYQEMFKKVKGELTKKYKAVL